MMPSMIGMGDRCIYTCFMFWHVTE